MVYCAVMGVVFDVPMNVVFVLELGVGGVVVAAVVSNLAMVVMLVGYVWWSGVGGEVRWRGFWRVVDVGELWSVMELALPSCFGVCLEWWWWYEIMTLLAGYLEEPRVAVATTAVLIQTNFMYTLSMGLSSCVSAMVGKISLLKKVISSLQMNNYTQP